MTDFSKPDRPRPAGNAPAPGQPETRIQPALGGTASGYGQPSPYTGHSGQTVQPAASYSGQAGAPIRKQGAWGLWWLVILTFGIYYFIWYARINRELCGVLRTEVPSDGQWWSQLIPIYGLVGLARTAQRLNAAHGTLNSPTRVSPFVTWFWASWWFTSQTRYLQRRVNILHDVVAALSVGRQG